MKIVSKAACSRTVAIRSIETELKQKKQDSLGRFVFICFVECRHRSVFVR